MGTTEIFIKLKYIQAVAFVFSFTIYIYIYMCVCVCVCSSMSVVLNYFLPLDSSFAYSFLF